ncbi:hypothetical protein MBT84_38120 [Streptomyces sp. MBT84]|nr:hypothetical protein [Streptomyces sp. MBT84]
MEHTSAPLHQLKHLAVRREWRLDDLHGAFVPLA